MRHPIISVFLYCFKTFLSFFQTYHVISLIAYNISSLFSPEFVVLWCEQVLIC